MELDGDKVESEVFGNNKNNSEDVDDDIVKSLISRLDD